MGEGESFRIERIRDVGCWEKRPLMEHGMPIEQFMKSSIHDFRRYLFLYIECSLSTSPSRGYRSILFRTRSWLWSPLITTFKAIFSSVQDCS